MLIIHFFSRVVFLQEVMETFGKYTKKVEEQQ